MQPPPTAPAGSPPAKPKVLKRPAQFSRTSAPMPQPSTNLDETADERRAAERRSTDRRAGAKALTIRLPSLPWQEDGRFGMILILTIAAINVVLALALTRQQAPTMLQHSAPDISLRANNVSMPAMNRNSDSAVTVYSEPGTLEESARTMTLDALSKNDNDFSIPADQSPPPVARALDGSGQ